VLGETDRDGDIGDDAVLRIRLAGVAVKAGRQIDGKDKSIFLPAKTVDLFGGAA